MRKTVIPFVVVALGVPAGAGAQSGTTDETRLRARRVYVVQQAPPSFAYSSSVAVGAVLPETGVTYYEVPAEYGVTQYRYTVVNGNPVLVDPGTRRVIQVIQ